MYEYPILFIGSKLDEPVFFQQISHFCGVDRSKIRGYFVIPETISNIRKSSYASFGIEHIQADLSDLITHLHLISPRGITPRDAASKDIDVDGGRLSIQEIEALRSFHPVSRINLKKRYDIVETNANYWDRQFYDGYGPNWVTTYHSHYPELKCYDGLMSQIAASDTERVFVLKGEAGSGKSTFLRHAAINLSSISNSIKVFEYQPQSIEFIPALSALNHHLSGEPAYLLVDDLHLFANEVSEVCNDAKFRNIKIITSARTGEWNSRIASKISKYAFVSEMPRYENDDIEPLIAYIDRYHTSPYFKRTSSSQKRSKFLNSKKQLLIAMKEATSGLGFQDIIRTEVERIPDLDTKDLFVIACIVTLPRVRIAKNAAREIYYKKTRDTSFEMAMTHLEGIVDVDNRGRLGVRHELYATEAIDQFVDFDIFAKSYYDILSYFSAFTTPVIKSVPVLDGRLFKFILSNKGIFDRYKKYGRETESVELFQHFEKELQLDGHFWLQYGLLLRRIGKHDEALNKLQRSLEAYPENLFAAHAFAQQKLIVSAGSSMYTTSVQRLISEAVDVLLERHQDQTRVVGDENSDEYPIFTLGYYHLNALITHNERDQARDAARRYFSLLEK